MCIAIFNNNGFIPESHIRESFANNPDGAGMAWVEDDKISVFKTMNDINGLIKLYNSIRSVNQLPIVLHFRIGTQGIKDISNVHPFYINEDMIMVHNGIIEAPITDPNKSDTYHLSILLSNLKTYKNLIDIKSIEYGFCETICAGYSKLIFLDNTGKTSIVNENLGLWIGDNWYSNKTYKQSLYIDIGGKSVKKQAYSEDWYDRDYRYSYKDHLYETDIYEDKYDEAQFDEDEFYKGIFCDKYNLPYSYVNSTMVDDWEDSATFDINNWIEYANELHYIGERI